MSLNIKLDNFDVFSKEVDIDKSTVIRASAGSGKTTVIEHVVIRLLLGIGVSEQVLPGQILITSFSRNAVKEIQNRIFARLYSLLSLLRLNKIEEILEKFPYIDICDGQIDKHEEYTNLIGEAFSSIDTFQIYTLESLKESIVSSFIINKDSIKRLPSAYLTTIYEEDSRFEFTYILHKLSKDDR
ncbi:MAG: UvrD-helicase domain-containing protein, partial [Chlamydiia bacterium]|nr:UvrD-helicase domain-containing protein [Chlamydiia bacterium]